MATYRYEAVDRDGRTRKGTLDADSVKQARANLRQQALTPITVDEVAQSQNAASFGFAPKISTAELALATRQLAGLLSAGLPLERALAAIGEQSESARVKERLAAVRGEVLGGSGLADAMGRFPRDFDPLYRGLVASGEATGQLASVMEKLAAYLESRQQLTSNVVLAFTYPAIVTVIAILIVGGLLTYVVPQVVSVFASTKQKLPFLTEMLILISDGLRKWGWIGLIVLVLGVVGFRWALRDPGLKRRWHKFLLGAPLLGRVLRGIDTARFASTLAILVGSGVPLLRALDTAAATLGNLALGADVDEAISRVREGSTLARALSVGGRFPPVLVHLIASGEQSGKLAEMLERAAKEQSTELERRTQMLTKMLEPLLVVGMGGVVLVIVLAILMPIIDLNTMVR